MLTELNLWKRPAFVWLMGGWVLSRLAGWGAVEAFEVSPQQAHALPSGKEADGIAGDFMLRNEWVEAVISGNLPLRRANMSTFYGGDGITPGCLYDLTLRGQGNDQIVIFSPARQRGSVSWVRVLDDLGSNEAGIETVVTAPRNNGLFRRHVYRLAEAWRGLAIETTLRNEGTSNQEVRTDDQWTVFHRTGTLGGITWADAVDPADKAGYAYAFLKRPSEGTNATVSLAPGQTLSYARFLAVGQSPAEAVGFVAERIGSTARLQGRLKTASGEPVATARITLRAKGAAPAGDCVAYPDANGRFAFKLPPAMYTIEVADLGRTNQTREVELVAGGESQLDLELSGVAAVTFDIRDEVGRSIPCKAQFRGIEGTPNPNLGPPNRAHGCADQYHSERGSFQVPVPPGRYEVTVTRGIEYSHLRQNLLVEAGESVGFTGVLRRLVDTTGWVSADYHNHSTPSGDNTCGTDDRIINLAAEHIEFAPTTEHNRFYDWRPHIERLGLKGELQSVPGIELTGSGPHLNSFPFNPVPFTQDNGAPAWHPDPRISAITLRDWQGAEPDRWIQINHPDMVHDFIDRNGDGTVDHGFAGLAELIDGLETQNYRGSQILSGQPFGVVQDSAGKEQVAFVREVIWLQMLNRGHRYAAMAVNDAHSVYGNGVGGWRMYLPSVSDQPAEIDWRENSRHAKAGRSVLTTGPFLQVQTADGILPGGQARGSGGVHLRVKVQCTDWIDIDRVQVLVNGRQPADLNFTRRTHADWFGNGVVKFDRTVHVPLSEDAHLIVVAMGEGFDLSIGYGTSAQARIRPCAYHNPIFVDNDGGGFTPNGDRLGWPLPTAKLAVAEVKALVAAGPR